MTSLALALAPAVAGAGNRLDPALERALAQSPATAALPVIVVFEADVGAAARAFASAGTPDEALTELRQQAAALRRPAEELLARRGAADAVRDLWITGALALTATPEAVRELAALPGVSTVKQDLTIHLEPVAFSSSPSTAWNLEALGAPELWERGVAGAGAVVAVLDSGFDPAHPDLVSRWRGGSGAWFDPDGAHDAPADASGHGTQTAGLIVGARSDGLPIGVAPRARFIAAKIFDDRGEASLSDIHLAFQWALDPDGDPETDDLPHVINNSWGFGLLTNECFHEFERDVELLTAAGIVVVFAAGNQGPAGATSISPANYPGSIAVGGVDAGRDIETTSGRGPSACTAEVYPDLVAPGVDVRTSDLTFGGAIPSPYVAVTGTSFAAPHVAGAIALLRGAFPAATPAQLESALRESATDLGESGPDHTYGHGLVDLPGAFQALEQLLGPGCADLDGDGFYPDASCGTAVDCNDRDAAVYPDAQNTYPCMRVRRRLGRTGETR